MMNSKLTQGCKQILILCPMGIILLVVILIQLAGPKLKEKFGH